jgi:hypothetical protein
VNIEILESKALALGAIAKAEALDSMLFIQRPFPMPVEHFDNSLIDDIESA